MQCSDKEFSFIHVGSFCTVICVMGFVTLPVYSKFSSLLLVRFVVITHKKLHIILCSCLWQIIIILIIIITFLASEVDMINISFDVCGIFHSFFVGHVCSC